MKKTRLIILAVVIVVILRVASKYNNIVTLNESVTTARSQVENVYQRRLDLVPNLVNTVKWFASQEQTVLLGVTNARASATKMNVNINDAQQLATFQKTQGELTTALWKLLAVVENYPDLKSNQNFLELQSQLEWTENRIAVERKNFNDVVNTYNIYLRRFPSNIVAWIWGFQKAEQFKAEEGADKAPVVDFDTNTTNTEATTETSVVDTTTE